MKSEMLQTVGDNVSVGIYSCSEFAFLIPLDRIDHNLTIHRSHTASAAARSCISVKLRQYSPGLERVRQSSAQTGGGGEQHLPGHFTFSRTIHLFWRKYKKMTGRIWLSINIPKIGK